MNPAYGAHWTSNNDNAYDRKTPLILRYLAGFAARRVVNGVSGFGLATAPRRNRPPQPRRRRVTWFAWIATTDGMLLERCRRHVGAPLISNARK